MSFQPVDSLRSRTFIGLLIAQFLAAFNDQAIHASAMFFAIHHKTLTEADAISLMPILFYAPWAIFCTLAGWLADRYSKRQSLVFWKIAEIVITLVALGGFWLGTPHGGQLSPLSWLGPWVVLSTVFLMGTHSAFFVPAKYGAMPEILPPHLLSKGNGLLESLSFLAVILGTVSGGVLSYLFSTKYPDHQYYIGFILVGLALIGAVASFLIEKMPAANPTRPFPTNLFKPLVVNLRIMLRSRPLALAVLGIAFFTFTVAFMRSTMYMHGETRNPRWTELHTSIVVGVVALGVGLGSPLAGFFSGGKVELGLVPLGAVGMIISLLSAALFLNTDAALIACLIGIGFFTGFYIVPLFTLLQHRAPKATKGDLLASSNFINVVGAIAASLLFKVLVLGAAWTGITPTVPMKPVARGTLVELEYDKQGRPDQVVVQNLERDRGLFAKSNKEEVTDEGEAFNKRIIEQAGSPAPGTAVVVGRFKMEREGRRVVFYRVLPDPPGMFPDDLPLEEYPLEPAHDNEPLTRYLFLGAGLMTLGILILLCRQMPDFFVRSLLWLRAQRRYRLQVTGLHHVPTDGPVILATNCDSFEDCMNVVAATDRFTRFLVLDGQPRSKLGPLLPYLARRTGLIALPAGSDEAVWNKAAERGARALQRGHMIGLTADGPEQLPELERMLQRWRDQMAALVIPVFCSAAEPMSSVDDRPRVRVVIGPALKPDASVQEIQQAIRGLDGLDEATESPAAVTFSH